MDYELSSLEKTPLTNVNSSSSSSSSSSSIPYSSTQLTLESPSESSLIYSSSTFSSSSLNNNNNNNNNLHHYLNPHHRDNIGIFASYLAVGFSLYFILTPLSFYMIDILNASPSQQSIIIGLTYLPWALKFVCGFITDSFPIYGLRRKPYLIGGWILYFLFNLIPALLVTPNLAMVALFIFLQTWAFIQADVCTDAMIVERSKLYENDINRGTFQAYGYIIRFIGGIGGSILGAILYNKNSWGWGCPMWGIFLVNGIFPLICIAPFMYDLVEVKSDTPPKLSVQLNDMWLMVQKRAVWLPCTFIYIYNCLYLTNPAWNSFLVEGLGFSNFDIGILLIVGAVLSYLGIIVYKKFLFQSSWRIVYIGTTIISAIFSGFQLMLVLQINTKIGMGAKGYQLFFAMGAYGMVQFVQAVQFLPACRMFIVMCPVGAEGASYAMLTTLSNLSSSVAYSIAAGCANIWNVSNSNLQNEQYEGMWKLTVLCAIAQVIPLVFIQLLPANNEEQIALQQEGISSKFKGQLFLFVFISSLLFVTIYSIMVII